MPLSFYYCQGDGFHAVIQEHNKKHAVEYFVYIINEMLEPEKGISEKDVTCEQVNVYSYKRRRTKRAVDALRCEVEGCKEPAVMFYCEGHAP